ncbi:hypothetical protein [Prosthecobacter vanneervenii]|uniref:Uncharacterized protein n=1 Tax=Prosthecobacter vanneervenii TaxID=48466 RepID=A0A7W7YBS5_9BACT|nr:hypothetical protein [Prosthecobacter vanneervenii]MBB5032955.1 hypothetical protein [Prosthecobacter vanneervenii]
MNVHRITRKDLYTKLDTPYNPPACKAEDESACEEFFEEWHDVRNGLQTVLERFGEHDDFDDKDFNLGDTAMLSRGIGVTFTRETMFKSQVLEAVAAYMAVLPKDYEVHITLQRDGEEDHDLFVSRDTVMAELPEDLMRNLMPDTWM